MTIQDRLADVRARVDAYNEAQARVDAARAALTSALDAARDAHGEIPRDSAGVIHHLNRMTALAEAGSRVMQVKGFGGYTDSEPHPVVVLKVTAARVTCLTEVGEVTFDRRPRAWWSGPGRGRGEHYALTLLGVEGLGSP